ncbi:MULTISPECIES: hypothetical protein [unclassified Streptomyces]|uniref:hypothetical protein n=1 Tax=unclassified Streptomyces TaxID=2593676 RepID=UPI0036E4DF8A
MDDELRARLRAAAGTHRPDRERMLARVERGMAQRPSARVPHAGRGAALWLRVAGATAAVCAVLVVGAYAVTTTGGGGDDGRRVAGPPSTPVPATEPPTPAPEAPAGPGALPAEDGPLWIDAAVDPHSNAYWAQSDVTLRTSRPLSALTVELRIALTGGVNTTGAWRSLPEVDFIASAREQGGFLVYRWTLKPGRTVPAGTHTFAGQYNHAEGDRDASGDDVTARAVPTTGQQAAVGDDFSSSH